MSAITQEQIEAWRKLRGQGMRSAIGEYTPPEFWKALDEIERLAKDQSDWRKGVDLIASYLGEKPPRNLSCVRIADKVIRVRARAEYLEAAAVHLKRVMKFIGDNGLTSYVCSEEEETELRSAETYCDQFAEPEATE